MKIKRMNLFLSLTLILVFVLSACSSPAPVPTNTPEPTVTITLTPTNTPRPTVTPRPTRTPDLSATQRYNDMFTLVQEFSEQGYIASAEGRYIELDDFTQTIPKINYYQWHPTGKVATSFVLSAHFRWSTATKTPDVSGCGIVFALQDNDYHYAVFLDKSLLRFIRSDAKGTYRLGKTSGSDAFKYDNPDEADFKLAVNQNHAYVFVDDHKVIEYTLAQNAIMRGELALALRSGTNKGYGTRCEMTNIRVWIAE